MLSENSAVVRRLHREVTLDAGALARLSELLSPPRLVKSKTDLMTEGQPCRHGLVLHEGWAACYKQLRDGRRQILKIAVPGDVLGFRGLFTREFDRSAVTLTRARISLFPCDAALEVIQTQGRIGAAFLAVSSCDEAIIAEHLVNVGRRSALERAAHLFVELGERLNAVGLVENHGFACPLTQDHLADALGLSAIHVNRVLRQLREQGFLTLKGRRILVHNRDGLRNLAHYAHDSRPG